MKERNTRLRVVVRLANLVLGLLVQAFVLGQGAPDILWSRNAHTNAVNSVTFAQDGSLLASGSSDGTIRIWQAANGSPVITLTNQNFGIARVAFVSNGILASWDITNALRVWQLSNGAVLREQLIARVYSTAFSSGGDMFAAVGGYDFPSKETLYVWRVSDGTLLKKFVPDQVASPAFSPNDQMVVAGLGLAEEYKMYVWQLSDGALVRAFANYQAGISLYGAPVFSPDSTRIAALTGPYGRTEIWDLQSGNLQGLIPEETGAPGQSVYVKLLVFTPDGKIAIMSDRDDKIRFWRVSEGKEIIRLALYDVETAGINALAMSPKGDLFAFGRLDGKVIVARVPVFITEASLSASNFILQWSGGSGSYQLQQRTNLATGTWENVGLPTTATGATNNISGASLFYRVQSLPN